MSLYLCPWSDCPYRSDDADDMDDHVVTAHARPVWNGDE